MTASCMYSTSLCLTQMLQFFNFCKKRERDFGVSIIVDQNRESPTKRKNTFVSADKQIVKLYRKSWVSQTKSIVELHHQRHSFLSKMRKCIGWLLTEL